MTRLIDGHLLHLVDDLIQVALQHRLALEPAVCFVVMFGLMVGWCAGGLVE